MKLSEVLQTTAEWLTSGDAKTSIVLSSRMRIARNVEGYAFPTWARKPEREKVFAHILPSVMALKELENPAIADSMDHFTQLEKQILVEQHLISREHGAKSTGCGLVVNAPRSLSIMINEEDHLRMQAFKPGLQLDVVWEMINKIDTELDERLNFAFSPQYGYLTACPTNVGTGMRASAMLHLPGLVLSEQINQIVQAVGKLGMVVRGLYGEGTEALGNLFQVSNQMTLGESEQEIISRLNKVIIQIVEHEEKARLTLLEKKPRMVVDQVGRAFGILKNSYSISSKEALNLLSIIRLGIELDMFPRETRAIVDELMISTQPAHLQMTCDQRLTTEDRDGLRSDLFRNKLSLLKKSDPRAILLSSKTKKGKNDE